MSRGERPWQPVSGKVAKSNRYVVEIFDVRSGDTKTAACTLCVKTAITFPFILRWNVAKKEASESSSVIARLMPGKVNDGCP